MKENDLIIIRMKANDCIHEFGFAKSYAATWKMAFSQNQALDCSDAGLSSTDYKMEDIDFAAPATMQIHLKGVPHTLSVGPDDDTSKMTDEFVISHKLKSDIKPRIESELLHTQVDSCLAYQNKLRQQLSHLRRLVISMSTYEPRALAAEAALARSIDEMRELDQISIEVGNKLKRNRSESELKDSEIAKLKATLNEEQTAFRKHKLTSEDQLHQFKQRVEKLEKVLKKTGARNNEETSEPFDSELLKMTQNEIEQKNDIIKDQSEKISSLEKEIEQLMEHQSKIERSHTECAEVNESLKARISELRSVESKSSKDFKLRNDSLAKEIFDLKQELMLANEMCQEKIKAEEMLEAKLKKQKEENKRVELSFNSLSKKFELSCLSLDNAHEENARLQHQLYEAEEELSALKSHSSSRQLRSLTDENTSLKDQVNCLRGDVLSLKSKLESVEQSDQSKALTRAKPEPSVSTPQLMGTNSSEQHEEKQVDNGRDVVVELFVEEESRDPSSPERDDAELDLESLQEEEPPMALSPVVEDRLLRNIYQKYTTESSDLLTLTRFGRFTKEFKIAGQTRSVERLSASGVKQSEDMLVYGDVDVVFMNTVTSVPAKENDSPMNLSSPHEKYPHDLNSAHINKRKKSPQAFNPGGGRLTAPTTPSAQIKGSHLTAHQFIAALQELAVRLYSRWIEQSTGTTFDCLPEKQRRKARRAAMDAMITKKLMPKASSLGLVPRELISLDQTLTTIHSSPVASNCLLDHISKVSAWFMHYSAISEIGIFKEGRVTSPSETLSPLARSSMSNSYSGSRGHVITPPEMHSFRGIPFKALSKFCHDYGIIPYLIKDPQLFSTFKEVTLWSKGNVELLLTALPDEVLELPAVAIELQNSPEISAKLAKKKVLLCGSFFVMLSTIANQSFPEMPPEKRIGRLFEWTAQSGGSYLMQKRALSS